MASSTSPLPPDLQELIDVWVAVERDTDALLGPLDDEQFNWTPQPGAWSIAQCFDHLNAAAGVYLPGIRQAIAEAKNAGRVRRGAISPTWWGRQFVASMGPSPRWRMRAPRTIKPAARRLKTEVWPAFVRLHGQLRAIVRDDGPAVDLNRASFSNPFFRLVRMRAGTALRVLAAHDRRHLAQAQGVRAAPGFPRS